MKAFNLRKIAALAQSEKGENLAPLLFLYAYESGCVDRLLALVYDPELLGEYSSVKQHLGRRSVERLALRGTPMMTLPAEYREVFTSYERAYHMPELIEAEKRELQKAAHESMLRSGVSPAEVARTLQLDPGNLHAFLVRGDPHRFTLDTARKIADYLAKQSL